MSSSFDIDHDAIRQLADLLNETGLTEIEVADQDRKIRVARQATPAATPAVTALPAAAPAVPPADEGAPEDIANHPGCVKAPMVGVIYTAPEPGMADFVSPGDRVSEGQTLLLVEAMKTFNPIRAHKGGTVRRILVVSGSPVEYGEPLLVIE